MTSSADNGEKRSVEDSIKHPDLFPDLRAKMKGGAPAINSTPPPPQLIHHSPFRYTSLRSKERLLPLQKQSRQISQSYQPQPSA